MSAGSSSYEIVEHTADVGIVAHAPTLEGLFEQTTYGLLEIMDAFHPGPRSRSVEINLQSSDVEALLVDWLNEIVFIQESNDATFTSVEVTGVRDDRIAGELFWADNAKQPAGTAVKAATYHQLSVRKEGESWTARVYVDV